MEAASARVQELFAVEETLVVSNLVRLEALQSLLGLRLGGRITPLQHKRLVNKIEEMLQMPPFEMRAFPTSAMENAERQNRQRVYCKTLDSLHLGVMASFSLKRLLTNDDQQAAAARALGFTVLMLR
jgi:hypothetical protein